jgi:hypothetical protein
LATKIRRDFTRTWYAGDIDACSRLKAQAEYLRAYPMGYKMSEASPPAPVYDPLPFAMQYRKYLSEKEWKALTAWFAREVGSRSGA